MDKLLEILSENSSFTSKELSLMLGEPEDYIKAQIKEYEQSGIIKGYHAIVDWEKVPDAGVTANSVENGLTQLVVSVNGDSEIRPALIRKLVEGGCDLYEAALNKNSLEDVFHTLTEAK